MGVLVDSRGLRRRTAVIDPDAKDLVQFGEEIEMARTKRAELRTAARAKSTPAPGAHTGDADSRPSSGNGIRDQARSERHCQNWPARLWACPRGPHRPCAW